MRKGLNAVVLLILGSLVCCKSDDGDPATPLIKGFEPIAGVVGSTVTISGLNFGGSQNGSVLFNGVPAEIKVYSSDQITAVVPEDATTGPISVKVGDAFATSTTEFTVLTSVGDDPSFYFGADLSHVNQILDHGGEYKQDNVVKDPYAIFASAGTDLVRLRLWHHPVWTKEVYEPDGTQLYNDLLDVEKAIIRSRAEGMKVLLDFHYSDFWADPGRQEIPAAWKEIKTINDLEDSVYNYTLKTLNYLGAKGLMPDMVQIGNEINCGMLYEYNDSPVAEFPSCNSCNGQLGNLKAVLNSGIKAVRDASPDAKIILHVADPENLIWWFDNITGGSGSVTDFDIIGFSYYPIWHTAVSVSNLSNKVAEVKSKYSKDVMILETAYPWTNAGDDSYNNLFGGQAPLPGFPYTQQGQHDLMKTVTQELIDGGGMGVIYWEPAWITSSMRDYWNTGSSWENCTFFDFDGNTHQGINYMKYAYTP